ncbi:MAG: hypothetical protein ACTSPX_01945 [Candidatus Thorarchaeota archaeon]
MTTTDPVANSIVLFAFLAALVILILILQGGVPGSPRALLNNSVAASFPLYRLVNGTAPQLRRGQKYVFSEQTVVSMTWRYRGRLDHAVLHVEKGPVLDAVFEMKFPAEYLPHRVREQDMFQAGLYALAIRDMGASCRDTRLVVCYCSQTWAKRCDKIGLENCVSCRHSVTFTGKFRPQKIERELQRMDGYWRGLRQPIPSPEHDKCRTCPYADKECQYAAT